MGKYYIDTWIDTGVLGELTVRVYFNHYIGFKSRDHLEPNEPESCELLEVLGQFGVNNLVDLLPIMDDELIEAITLECLEWMQSERENV